MKGSFFDLLAKHEFGYLELKIFSLVAHVVAVVPSPHTISRLGVHLSGWLLLMWHSRLRWHRVLTADALLLLLLLHVLLVRHLLLLLRRNVMGRDAGVVANGIWSGDGRVRDLFRRVDGGFPINTVFGSRSGLGRVQTCLRGT